MPCYTESQEERLDTLLCSACRAMSVDQLNSVEGLLGWYKEHLQTDWFWNKGEDRREIYSSELKRIGYVQVSNPRIGVKCWVKNNEPK